MKVNGSTSALQQALVLIVVGAICSVSDAFQVSSFSRGVHQTQTAAKSNASERTKTALGMATWSNGQAIKEYQGRFIVCT